VPNFLLFLRASRHQLTNDHCFGGVADFAAGGAACAWGVFSLDWAGEAGSGGGCGAAGAAWPNETESPNNKGHDDKHCDQQEKRLDRYRHGSHIARPEALSVQDRPR
jgi:hypothetical protein